MDASPILSASGVMSPCGMAPAWGDISCKSPHHCLTLFFQVLFSSVIHTCWRERIAFAISDSLLLLPKGYQNLSASHGCSIWKKAESTVAIATIKCVCGKWWEKVISFPSNHNGWASYERQLVPRSFINTHRHIIAFIQSCGLYLSKSLVRAFSRTTLVCLFTA